jgi:hypothetical protein
MSQELAETNRVDVRPLDLVGREVRCDLAVDREVVFRERLEDADHRPKFRVPACPSSNEAKPITGQSPDTDWYFEQSSSMILVNGKKGRSGHEECV